MKSRYIVFAFVTFSLWACSKKSDPTLSESIKIVSLSASINPVKAYEITEISVEATGENLQYGWVANHGRILGNGKVVQYNACTSCAGHNTITCRVFNETGEVSDTIMIRVYPYPSENK
ncbi:MAG: hypothetical protein NTX61_09190 [Bacteroidetes bacterium]|nr:hypothetical protein [Bacteroidota bacterium]